MELRRTKIKHLILLLVVQTTFSCVNGVGDDDYPLHKSIFDKEPQKLINLLKTKSNEINKQDIHGNTALHLSLMLGQKECIRALLANDALVEIHNLNGYSSLDEAISYGNREIIFDVLKKQKQQRTKQRLERTTKLVESLKKMPDFYMEFKREIININLNIDDVLLSHSYKFYKRGTSIRLDTTQMTFSVVNAHTNSSFLFRGDLAKPMETLIAMDNDHKTYQLVLNANDKQINDEVDVIMSLENSAYKLHTIHKNLTEVRSNWVKSPNQQTINGYNCDVYQMFVDNLDIEIRARYDHLTQTEFDNSRGDIMVQAIRKKYKKYKDIKFQHRESIAQPAQRNVQWAAYINSKPGQYPTLGRSIVTKSEGRVQVSPILSVTNNIPLTLDMLMDVFDAVGKIAFVQPLQEFISTFSVPNAFPVQLKILVKKYAMERVTLTKFEKNARDLKDDLFKLPLLYTKNDKIWPNLF